MGSFISRAGRGFAITMRAIGFVCSHPSTWHLIIVPVLINMVLTVLAFFGLLSLGINLMHGSVGELFGTGFLQWTYYILTYIGMIMLVFILTFMTWLLGNATINAIFEELLAKKTMKILGIKQAEDRTSIFIYMCQSIVFVFGLLFVNIFLIPLNFVPVVGTIAAICIGGYINSWAISWQYSDMALGMRGLSFKEKISYGRAHHAEYIGLGLPGILMTIIPFIGPFILAITVVSAVMMAEEMIQRNSQHPALEEDNDTQKEIGEITQA